MAPTDMITSAQLTRHLLEMGPTGRFALSPDHFARLFEGEMHDDLARRKGRDFALGLGCEMLVWTATNEVFFVRAPTDQG